MESKPAPDSGTSEIAALIQVKLSDTRLSPNCSPNVALRIGSISGGTVQLAPFGDTHGSGELGQIGRVAGYGRQGIKLTGGGAGTTGPLFFVVEY